MTVNVQSLVEIINSNKNKRLIASKIIDSNPKVIPILPKLIKSNSTTNIEDDKNTNNYNINRAAFEAIYNKIRTIKDNNENITKLFPDIELAIQILISSILSPKKMTDIQLNYRLENTENISPVLTSQILTLIEDYINKNYDLEEKLPDIIREALFETGAYITAVIPESSVDEVINSDLFNTYSTESFKNSVDNLMHNFTKNINILNFKETVVKTIEEKSNKEDLINYLASENYINITDNFNLFKFNRFKEKIKNNIISSAIRTNTSVAAEALDKLNYIDIFRQKGSTITNKNLEVIKTKDETKRKSLGKPMVIKINTESVIPVFVPGDESNHIGYFILLDENGKPLSDEIGTSTYRNINEVINNNSSSSSTQLSVSQKAYKNLIYDNSKGVDTTQIFDAYKDIIEKQLYSTIKNSLYGSDVEIGNRNEIYFIMFARALAEQKTNMVFIPKDLVVYYAFSYTKLGIGKSLLENLSILSSLRAILLFAKIMSFSKSSIDVTKVNISLDPNDPDPEKTIEQVQDSVLKLRQNYFPLGISNPVDLIDWIQRAGLQFEYDGHPGLPNVKIGFENSNLTHTIPNNELEEDLRKQSILSLGLSPETIDDGFSPEFATSIVNNNILLSKRVMLYQKKLVKFIDKFINMIIINDEDLRFEIKTKLEELMNEISGSLDENDKALYTKDKDNFYNVFIDRIAENIKVSLPKPENTNLANLSQEYDIYKENLEKILDSIISQEIVSEDMAGELTVHIDSVKNTYKHYLLRKWMSENNFYPEAFDIADANEENSKNMIDSLSSHLTSLMSNSNNLFNVMQKFKLAGNKDLENVTGSSSESSYSEPSSSNENTESGIESGETKEEGNIVSNDDISLDL
ncbi:MAG: Virion structural protein [uncultured bacterium]|nr:MAG: Virion structural protein [uncultured bacterium]